MPFYLAADAGGQLRAGHCAEGQLALGMLLKSANSRGRAGVCGDGVLSRHPLVVEAKRQFVAAKK